MSAGSTGKSLIRDSNSKKSKARICGADSDSPFNFIIDKKKTGLNNSIKKNEHTHTLLIYKQTDGNLDKILCKKRIIQVEKSDGTLQPVYYLEEFVSGDSVCGQRDADYKFIKQSILTHLTNKPLVLIPAKNIKGYRFDTLDKIKTIFKKICGGVAGSSSSNSRKSSIRTKRRRPSTTRSLPRPTTVRRTRKNSSSRALTPLTTRRRPTASGPSVPGTSASATIQAQTPPTASASASASASAASSSYANPQDALSGSPREMPPLSQLKTTEAHLIELSNPRRLGSSINKGEMDKIYNKWEELNILPESKSNQTKMEILKTEYDYMYNLYLFRFFLY